MFTDGYKSYFISSNSANTIYFCIFCSELMEGVALLDENGNTIVESKVCHPADNSLSLFPMHIDMNLYIILNFEIYFYW